jgi:glutathione S-transferase
MKLFYCETLNPRKACAVARYLESPVEFVRLDLGRGDHQTPEFLAMNPNGKAPVLQNGGWTLWESNAIMCHLSNLAQADLWPRDDARQIEVMRWLNWDSQHFTRHASVLYFEHVVKPMLGIPAADAAALEEATKYFRTYASVLDSHLRDRKFLVGDSLTVADFATAVTLPYAGQANLPLADFPAIQRWHERLNELPAWREPFPA